MRLVFVQLLFSRIISDTDPHVAVSCSDNAAYVVRVFLVFHCGCCVTREPQSCTSAAQSCPTTAWKRLADETFIEQMKQSVVS